MSARILIAEDEADIRNNLKLMLSMEGYQVWTAVDGRQALALARQHLPDLILSDVMMPEMNGFELLQALRSEALTAHIPVIVLTARADRSNTREGMNLGADDYLTKPFMRSELLGSIRARLEKAEAQQHASKRLATQTHHLTHYDKASGLPNRSHFLVLLTDALNRHIGTDQTLALFIAGLDNLPQMMQVLGVGVLDVYINEMGRRIRDFSVQYHPLAQTRCTVVRVGDDRMAILVSQWDADHPAIEAARALRECLQVPLRSGTEEHFPAISVAVALHRSTAVASSADVLVARLELALADAREQAGERLAVRQDGETVDMSATFRLHNALHRVVERNELITYFQPQVATGDASVRGFEALMRWQHTQFGLVSPVRFIPLAEDNGQIVPMGAWILQDACRQAVQWRSLWPNQPVRVAVNLSLRQFCDTQLIAHVQAALEVSGLQPELLELEITEGTAMVDLQQTLELLRRFKAMGLKLAIDDFGTGYSSLAYLKRFPLDLLKIDQSFVRQLCLDREDQAIAQAIITLAHQLGLMVIAEGVETREQHALLLQMGCDEIQGYLHGKPMPGRDLPTWAAQRPAART